MAYTGGHHGPQYETNQATNIFDLFCSANTFHAIYNSFQQLCDVLNLKPSDNEHIYAQLKSKLNSWKAQSLWTKLDKRCSHKDYQKGQACTNTRVLIIGAGPCGMRMSIELAMLGAKVVIVEKRDRFSRNNVLHLWPYLINDLKSLGAKKFFGKFCAGAIDHISIRTLQCILLKVALIFGVEIHTNTSFEGLIEPPTNQSEKIGWKAKILPADSPVSEYEFDVLVGADGKRNTLEGFKRKEFRGKLAIAITANFINNHSQAEARVEEISGVAFIFNQKFFQDLKEKTGIDLENIVYYKDETHYFVMTAKKQSLLKKGVLIEDHNETFRLLSRDNVNQDKLMRYAKEAADVSTEEQLPQLEFAHNHYGQADVAMFDFTSIFAAENASRAINKNGHKLLITIVGDSLLEPFWPTGSGCARGFFGSFDAAWMIRQWASGKVTPLEVIAERESIYQLLSQTTPENISKNFNQYSIDPNTRYPNLNCKSFKIDQIRGLYECGETNSKDEIVEIPQKRAKHYDFVIDSAKLLKWCQKHLEYYKDIVQVTDLTTSWKNGLALCGLIHHHRPHLIDVYSLNEQEAEANNQQAFDVAHVELGIPPVMSGQEMADCPIPDKLTMVSYISQFHDIFRKEKPPKSPKSPQASMEKSIKRTAPTAASSFFHKLTRWTKKKGKSKDKENEPELISESRESLKRKEQSLFPAMSKKRITQEKEVTLKGYTKISDLEPKVNDVSRGDWGMEVGVRGQNKVSALAGKLVSQFECNNSPVPERKTNAKPMFGVGGLQSSSQYCYFCDTRVYLMERQTAEGIFFHRGCLKCEFCGSGLRIGNYSFEKVDGEAKFYCIPHLGMKKRFRRKRSMSDLEEKKVNGEISIQDKVSQKISPESKRKLAAPRRQGGLDMPDLGSSLETPERIEFENSMDELVETDEDVQTEHNLRISVSTSPFEDISEDEEEQDSSESTESSDQDIDEGPEPDRVDEFHQSLNSSYKLTKDWLQKSQENLFDEDLQSHASEGEEEGASPTASRDSSRGSSQETCPTKLAAKDRRDFFNQQSRPIRIDPKKMFDKKSPTQNSANAGLYIDTDQVIPEDENSNSKHEALGQISEEADNEASSEDENTDSFRADSAASFVETEDGIIYEKNRTSVDDKFVTGRERRKKKANSESSFTISTPSESHRSMLSDLSLELDVNRKVLGSDMESNQSSMNVEEQSDVFKTPENSSVSDSGRFVTPDNSYDAEGGDDVFRFASPVNRPEKLSVNMNVQSNIDSPKSPKSPMEIDEGKRLRKIAVDRSFLESVNSEDERYRNGPFDSEIGRKKIKPLSISEMAFIDSSDIETPSVTSPQGKMNYANKRILPLTPTKSPLSSGDIKQRQFEEREKLRARAREKARSKSDEELGVEVNYTPNPKLRLRSRSRSTEASDSELSPGPGRLEDITETESDTMFNADGHVLPSTKYTTSSSNLKSTDSEDTDNKTLEGNALDTTEIAISMDNTIPRSGKKKPSYDTQTSEEILEMIRENMDSEVKKKAKKKDKKEKTPKAKDKSKTPRESEGERPLSPQGEKKRRSFLQLFIKKEKRKSNTFDLSENEMTPRTPDSGDKLDVKKDKSSKSAKNRKEKYVVREDSTGSMDETPKTSKSKSKSKTHKSKDKKKDKRKKKDRELSQETDEGQGQGQGRASLSDKVKGMNLKDGVFLNTASERTKKHPREEKIRAPVANLDDEFSETDSESSISDRRKMSNDIAEDVLMKKVQNRVQKAARRQQRQRELKRLHMAQEIQRQLNEVEVKQRELEDRGVVVEKALRGEGPEGHRTENEMMQEWFNLVHEKHVLVRYESELMVRAKELELEDRHGRLDQALREKMTIEESRKTAKQVEDEKKILNELLEVVAQRDALVALLEEDRLREKEEDKDLENVMVSKGYSLSPVSYSIKTGKSTHNSEINEIIDI